MGIAVIQRAAITVANPNLAVALANDLFDFGAMFCSLPPVGMSLLSGLRRDGKKSCDGNHNLVESEKAIAQTEKHTRESGGRRKMGQKAIRALALRGAKKTIEARGSDRGTDRTRSKDATARPLLRHRRAPPNRHRKRRGRVTGWEESGYGKASIFARVRGCAAWGCFL